MKIIQINVTYGQGSTGKIVQNLYEALLQQGHNCKVFFGRGEKNDNPDIVKISDTPNNIVDVFKTRFFNHHGEANVKNTKMLINKIQQFNPDIIQLHNIHGYYLNYQLLFEFLNESKIPVVWLLHDQWAISGSAANFDSVDINWLDPKHEHIKELSKIYPSHLYMGLNNVTTSYNKKRKYFNMNNLTIVTPSNWLKKTIKSSFLSNKKIREINNGIDLDVYKPKVRNNSTSKTIIGVANRWTSTKGLKYFKKLAIDLDKEEYQLILVGLSKKQIKEMPSHVTCYMRTQSIEHLTLLYSEADIFVNPTLEDNFPTVNLEAQACGTPVITFNTGGSGESITNNTGKIVEKGDYQSLLTAIKKWPKKTPSIISNCRNNVQKYSIEKMMDNYIRLYEFILKN